jgi:ribosomal protein S18 acetylase RimI-like enzyme
MIEAQKAGYPVYLESTPAAVGLYKRLGFQELRRLKVINKDEDHYLTVFLTPKETVG